MLTGERVFGISRLILAHTMMWLKKAAMVTRLQHAVAIC